MQVFNKKKASERGASMLIALLFFLVATMVSIVIISTSVTTVQRMDDDRQRERDYLAIASAARTIRDRLASSDCTITKAGTESEGPDGTPVIAWGDAVYESSGDFGPILAYMVQKIKASTIPATEENPCTVEINIDVASYASTGQFPPCTLTLCMFSDPDIEESPKDVSYVMRGWIEADEGGQAVYLNDVSFSGSEIEEGLNKRCELRWNDSTQIRFTTIGS